MRKRLGPIALVVIGLLLLTALSAPGANALCRHVSGQTTDTCDSTGAYLHSGLPQPVDDDSGHGMPVKQGAFQSAGANTDQTIVLTGTPQSLTVPNGATSALFTVSGGPAGWRADSGTLLAATLQQMPVGITSWAGPLASFQLVLPTGVPASTVYVSYYK